jgi:Tfp pilus assembly PilM family ATPase
MTTVLQSLRSRRLSRRIGWLGVDIGACAVKIAQIERCDVGWKIRHASLTPIPTGADPLEIAAEALAANLTRRPPWFERPAACTVTTTMELHNLELSPDSGDSPSQALARLPGADNQKCTHALWQSSWKQKESAKQPYHVMRMSQRQALQLAKVAASCRVECRVLDCPPYALARTVALAGDASREPVAVVDCAARRPLLTIVNRGAPYYTRELRECGFVDTVTTIGERFGLDFSEALCLLRQFARADATAPAHAQAAKFIDDVTSGPRKRFIAEVVRTIKFLETEGRALTPKRIWLVGGGAALPGLDRDAATATGIPTHIWRLHASNSLSEQPTSGEPHAYAAALALSAIPMLK